MIDDCSEGTLASPRRTSELLNQFGVTARRTRGQNFLVDDNILRRIVSAADLCSEDVVVEVGSGIGTLTIPLCRKAKHVISIELDKRLEPILALTTRGLGNLTRITGDALRLGADELVASCPQPNKMISNLPYNVAAPLILKWLQNFDWISNYTVMVQKEIAERMTAEPGTREYSGYTAKLAYYARVERLFNVSRNVFLPQPNVDSAVVKIVRHPHPPVEVSERPLFDVIDAGFGQRRKTLANALFGLGIGLEKPAIEELLIRLGHKPGTRAEQLSLAQFAELTSTIAVKGRPAGAEQ